MSEATAVPAETRKMWPRVAALALAVAAIGLPVNHLYEYALLLIATVVIFSGRLTLVAGSWLIAVIAVLIAALLPLPIAPAPIAQGENVFLPGKPGNVLQQGLPADVYQFMRAEFDAQYPPAERCKEYPRNCWLDQGFPTRLYAFSADGVFGHPRYSRNVTGIEFSDPVWLRLGFVNDRHYNWPDHRGERDRRFWMGLSRWHITMPWFVMYQFPADYAGSQLCWRGVIQWPQAGGHYTSARHDSMACRTLGPTDIGQQIFGVAIKPGSLAMTLHAPAGVQVRLLAMEVASLLAVGLLLILLVRVKPSELIRPFTLIALSLIAIAIIDASFIGGWRPMDGGDDGLFYTGTGRLILQHLLHGDVMAALAGGENVYFYGGPGLRYLRALEMIFFGDTNLGYLSLVLLLPIMLLGLYKRFVSDAFAWRLALIFVAVPIGEIFGTSFLDYAKWAARGFADPAAHILLVWGVWVLVAPREGAPRAGRAAGGALLLALAVFTKPIVAPIPGVLLAGAGLAALYQRQWRRLAGLCVGFLPVLAMPLHNWYFGHAFVLLSSNACLPGTCVMTPSAILSALGELARLDFGGPYLHQAGTQIVAWLSQPSQTPISIPFNAAAVAIVFYVTLLGRDFDPWLRLIGAAVLAEYAADFVYAATPRYFFEMWLLSAVVVATFIEQRVPAWMQKHGWQRAGGVLERFIGYQPAQAS
jgi:hypothetical protein